MTLEYQPSGDTKLLEVQQNMVCPDCGGKNVYRSGGCPFCPECGWSKCS